MKYFYNKFKNKFETFENEDASTFSSYNSSR